MKIKVGAIYKLDDRYEHSSVYPRFIWIASKIKKKYSTPPLVQYMSLGVEETELIYNYESSIRSMYRIYNETKSR